MADKKLERAINCILEQYQEKIQLFYHQKGPGLCVFEFLVTKDNQGSNCYLFYSIYKDHYWSTILDTLTDENKEYIEANYKPEDHYLILVQVPCGKYYQESLGTVLILDKSYNVLTFEPNSYKTVLEQQPDEDNKRTKLTSVRKRR